jgi:hypothetical protein
VIWTVSRRLVQQSNFIWSLVSVQHLMRTHPWVRKNSSRDRFSMDSWKCECAVVAGLAHFGIQKWKCKTVGDVLVLKCSPGGSTLFTRSRNGCHSALLATLGKLNHAKVRGESWRLFRSNLLWMHLCAQDNATSSSIFRMHFSTHPVNKSTKTCDFVNFLKSQTVS